MLVASSSVSSFDSHLIRQTKDGLCLVRHHEVWKEFEEHLSPYSWSQRGEMPHPRWESQVANEASGSGIGHCCSLQPRKWLLWCVNSSRNWHFEIQNFLSWCCLCSRCLLRLSVSQVLQLSVPPKPVGPCGERGIENNKEYWRVYLTPSGL